MWKQLKGNLSERENDSNWKTCELVIRRKSPSPVTECTDGEGKTTAVRQKRHALRDIIPRRLLSPWCKGTHTCVYCGFRKKIKHLGGRKSVTQTLSFPFGGSLFDSALSLLLPRLSLWWPPPFPSPLLPVRLQYLAGCSGIQVEPDVVCEWMVCLFLSPSCTKNK